MLDPFNQTYYNPGQFYPGYPLKLGQVLSILMMQTWDFYQAMDPEEQTEPIKGWLATCAVELEDANEQKPQVETWSIFRIMPYLII